MSCRAPALLAVGLALALVAPTAAQESARRGWTLHAMAQAHPIVTTAAPFAGDVPIRDTEPYLTQPALMLNLASASSRWVLRATLDFEAWTLPDGEYTYGGWGEGFLDRRHPHTLVHELMLSLNVAEAPGGAFSLSAGKGFAPYGTEDPMSRPAVKYPTNHHLSQVLERWTVNAVYAHDSGWTLEAGLFGGTEPEGPYDMSNIESFGDSWSARLGRRFGAGASWEATASYASVSERHHGSAQTTQLINTALRHDRAYGFGGVYALVEASKSEPAAGRGYVSVLAESRLDVRGHRPYYRIEYATRPEYERTAGPGSDGFFRYDHDGHAIGATRWLINTVGYGYDVRDGAYTAQPFVELTHNRVRAERGGIDPKSLFGRTSFLSVTAGFRLFVGGDAMRMGTYGVLDAMYDAPTPTAHHHGHGHQP